MSEKSEATQLQFRYMKNILAKKTLFLEHRLLFQNGLVDFAESLS